MKRRRDVDRRKQVFAFGEIENTTSYFVFKYFFNKFDKKII